MATVDTGYGSPTGITITLHSPQIADTNSQQSDEWSAVTGNVVDMLVRGKTAMAGAATDYIYVHTAGAVESGSPYIFTDGATGTNSSFTTANLLNSPLLGAIKCNGTNIVVGGPWSLASAWGGFIPPAVALIYRNESGASTSSTDSDHDFDYITVTVTSA